MDADTFVAEFETYRGGTHERPYIQKGPFTVIVSRIPGSRTSWRATIQGVRVPLIGLAHSYHEAKLKAEGFFESRTSPWRRGE